MIGYLTAGVTITFFSEYVTWRFPIQIQGFAQIPLSLYFYFEDEKCINIETTNDEKTIDKIRKTRLDSPRYTDRRVRQSHAPIRSIKTEVASPQRPKPRETISGLSAYSGIDSARIERKMKLIPSVEFKKQIRRQATRIDAVEINHLQRITFILYFRVK